MDEIAFYTINLQKGIDKTVSFSFYESSSCGCGCSSDEGTPVNLARKRCLVVIRSPVSKKEIDRLTTENGRIQVGSFENGELVESDSPDSMQLSFPHEITVNYEGKKLVYDLVLIDSNDSGDEVRDCIMTGQILINEGVAYAV